MIKNVTQLQTSKLENKPKGPDKSSDASQQIKHKKPLVVYGQINQPLLKTNPNILEDLRGHSFGILKTEYVSKDLSVNGRISKLRSHFLFCWIPLG